MLIFSRPDSRVRRRLGPSLVRTVGIGFCLLAVGCHPAHRPQEGGAKARSANIGSAAIADAECSSAHTCSIAIVKRVGVFRQCAAEHGESQCGKQRAEISRLSAVLKELEHEEYANERASQRELSASDAQRLSACDDDMWHTDIDPVPTCWYWLLTTELKVFARERSACEDASDCVVVDGLNCPSQLAANGRFKDEIAARASELRAVLPSKRFVAISCDSGLVSEVECVGKRCLPKRQ